MEPYRFSVALSVSLLIFLFLVEVVSAEKKSAYHALDVAAQLREVSSPPVQLNTTSEKGEMMVSAWSMQIFHRDDLVMGNVSYEQRLRESLERDSRRVKALNRRLERKLNGKKEGIEGNVKIDDLGGEVISGLSLGSGEYFIRIGVGTPARMEYLILDTGSDVTWVQCKPCTKCYDQVDPMFDPSLSTSYTPIPCKSQLCYELNVSDYDNKGCLYGVSYGDGSFTIGHFVKETLTFGTTTVPSMAIGCGQDNEGFTAAGGLLGLGAGLLSFPTQLGSSGTTFSYCLVDIFSDDKGTLRFGPGAVSAAESVFTPLLKNPKARTFYYVALTSITVGRVLVSLPKIVSGFDKNGRGGIIVDSGTTITQLQEEALRDAFVVGTADLPRANGNSLFDTCYDLSGRQNGHFALLLHPLRVIYQSLGMFSSRSLESLLTLPSLSLALPSTSVNSLPRIRHEIY